MLWIPWTAYRTNVSILNELSITDRLSTLCRRRILRYFGHITRREHNNLDMLIVQGKVEGRRPRGRSPSRWIDFLFLFIYNLNCRDFPKPKKHFHCHFLSAIRWRFHICHPTFRLSAVIVNFLFCFGRHNKFLQNQIQHFILNSVTYDNNLWFAL